LRIDVTKLDHEIGVDGARGNLDHQANRTGDLQGPINFLARIDQDVLTIFDALLLEGPRDRSSKIIEASAIRWDWIVRIVFEHVMFFCRRRSPA
jgi:hypothetical protein